MIGWTTLPTKFFAKKIIQFIKELDLVACGQISGPLESYYKWNGRMEDIEWRATLKYSEIKGDELSQELDKLHPYEVPEWTTLAANSTEKYKTWSDSKSNPSGETYSSGLVLSKETTRCPSFH